MTVLTPANALPGAPFSQHGSGQTTMVTSYVYPGAVQPLSTTPAVLSYTNALPNAAFPQHLSGQTTTVQTFMFPGAVQPSAAGAAAPIPSGWLLNSFGFLERKPLRGLVAGAALGVALVRNPTLTRRNLIGLQ